MADTDVDTTTATKTEVPAAKDLKEKKEVVEEPEKTENGSDAPANGTEENGAEHKEGNADDAEEEEDEVEGEGEGEGDEEEEEEGEAEETESDGHPVKRAAEEEKETEAKKPKTENGDSTEVQEKSA